MCSLEAHESLSQTGPEVPTAQMYSVSKWQPQYHSDWPDRALDIRLMNTNVGSHYRCYNRTLISCSNKMLFSKLFSVITMKRSCQVHKYFCTHSAVHCKTQDCIRGMVERTSMNLQSAFRKEAHNSTQSFIKIILLYHLTCQDQINMHLFQDFFHNLNSVSAISDAVGLLAFR